MSRNNYSILTEEVHMSSYALITGSTGDIGFAIASRLAEAGCNIILNARSSDALKRRADELSNLDSVDVECLTSAFDVGDSASVDAAIREFARRVPHIDVLVNCAGISGGGNTIEFPIDTWDQVIRTNLSGTFYVTRAVLSQGWLSQGGRIINIASTGGKQGVIHGAPYSASKHGVVGFTKSLGLELARSGSGITVNAVCPGFVESEMAERVRENYARIWETDIATVKKRIEERVPIGRYVTPAEVAEMVYYLTTPQAAAITAQALNVCGGLGNV